MPLSVTCQCGAKLEIDDAFVGKAVPCPDCSRLLPTTPASSPSPAFAMPIALAAPPAEPVPPLPAPPSLDLPDYRRTSGLAVYSLATSLVLGFVGGGIVGILFGLLALREIKARPGRVRGTKLAKAGIIVGAALTLIAVLQFVLPGVLGIDRLFREFKYVDRLQFTASDVYKIRPTNNEQDLAVAKPSAAWARLKPPSKLPDGVEADDIILINLACDAYVAFQTVRATEEDAKARLKQVMDRFAKSELVNMLGELNGRPLAVELPEWKGKTDAQLHQFEGTFELRLAGKHRRFLVQFPTTKDVDIIVKIAASPRNQFDRLEEDFRKAFRKPD